VLTNLGLSVLHGSSAGVGHQAAVSRLVTDLQAAAAQYSFWGHSLAVQLKDSRQPGKAACPLLGHVNTCVLFRERPGTHARACNKLLWVAAFLCCAEMKEQLVVLLRRALVVVAPAVKVLHSIFVTSRVCCYSQRPHSLACCCFSVCCQVLV